MRGLGTITAVVPAAADKPVPGIPEASRMHVNIEARRLLLDAIGRGQRPEGLVIHIEADDVRVVRRDELVQEYTRAGIRPLARKLERLVVARGHVGLLIVADETVVRVVPLAALVDVGSGCP